MLFQNAQTNHYKFLYDANLLKTHKTHIQKDISLADAIVGTMPQNRVCILLYFHFSVGKTICVDIIPRPRPRSKALGGSDSPNVSGVVDGHTTTTPGAIPPPSVFKRHKSLPNRHRNIKFNSQLNTDTLPANTIPDPNTNPRHSNNATSHTGSTTDNGKSTPPNSVTLSTNPDLISLASPIKESKKLANNSFQDAEFFYSELSSPPVASAATTVPSNSTPFSANSFLSSFLMTSNITRNHSSHSSVSATTSPCNISTVMNNNPDGPPIGFYMHRSISSSFPSSGSSPVSVTSPPVFPITDFKNVNNNNSPNKDPTASQLVNQRTQLEGATSGNNNSDCLYKHLSQKLERMRLEGDLIDLGQRKEGIVKYFDPLHQPPDNQLAQDISSASEARVQTSNNNPSSSSSSKLPYVPSSCTSTMNSRASTATSAFSYIPGDAQDEAPKKTVSYPCLDAWEGESLYSMLTLSAVGTNSDDVSSFYDLYNNPALDYEYRVSCSSPSGTSGLYEPLGGLPDTDCCTNFSFPPPLGFSHFVQPYATTQVGGEGRPPKLPPRNYTDKSLSPEPKKSNNLLSSPELDAVTRRKSRIHEQVFTTQKIAMSARSTDNFILRIRFFISF